MEILKVYQNGIYDFRGVILPNVFEELLLTESFEEEALGVIGAVQDGSPVGAAVYRFLENEEVFVYSIYVLEDYRNKGIGHEMMDAILSEALELFDFTDGDNHSRVPAFVHTDYTLPSKEFEAFEKFLKSAGFVDFMDKPSSYIFESEELLAALGRYEPAAYVHNLREALAGNDELVGEFFEEMGVNANSGLSFFGGDTEAPAELVLVEQGNDNDFMLTSVATTREPEDYYTLKIIEAVVNEIHKAHETFTLLVSGERNTNLNMWDELALKAGEKCQRREAGMYIVFE